MERSTRCELQGATVDGVQGLAYPKESKLSKYVSMGMKLVEQRYVTQRQMQVVCGGLVYFSMFRRPLLGLLNGVWRFIESFCEKQQKYLALPKECRFEILRFICLAPSPDELSV